MNKPTFTTVRGFLLKGLLLGLCVYALIFLAFSVSKPFVPAAEESRITSCNLDSLRPTHWNYLSTVVNEQTAYDRRMLSRYLQYLNTVNEKFPHQPEVLGLLGFIRFHLGDKEQAAALYQEAIKLRPEFFWFYHNLALIYLKNGQLNEALHLILFAVKLNPEPTLQYMLQPSAIHPSLETYAIPSNYSGTADFLKSGYDTLLLILQQAMESQQNKDALDLTALSKVPLRVF